MANLLLHNIWSTLYLVTTISIQHIYWEAKSVTKLIASFVT